MKIIVNKEEKNTILEMHSKLKKNKVILEQAGQGVDAQLQAYLDNGSIKNGKVVPMNSTNPQLKYAIKQESTKTPGKIRYLFIDKRIGVMDNGKFIFLDNTEWAPGQATPKPDPNAGDIAKEIAAGWKEKKDLGNYSDAEIAKLFTKHPKYDLYKSITEPNKTGNLSPDQEAWWNAWSATTDPVTGQVNGDLYKINLTPQEKASGAFKETRAPGSEKAFAGGLTVYYAPNSLSTVKGSQLSQIIKNQTVDKETCKKNIADYVYAYDMHNDVPEKQLDAAKRVVQACAYQYYNKWGILGGGKKLDADIDKMRGGTGGPTTYGERSQWRLK